MCNSTSTLEQCEYRPLINSLNKNTMHANGWTRGAYQCLCRSGYYSARHPNGFNGTYMEVAYQEFRENVSTYYVDDFRCVACAEGCSHCSSSAPCLASYNWIFRVSLLSISVLCAGFTLTLAGYMYRHRKVKVFKVASPIFLTITLLGCAIMYFEVCSSIAIAIVVIPTEWNFHWARLSHVHHLLSLTSFIACHFRSLRWRQFFRF